MRLGIVIGRVTLTQKEPVYNGGRLLIVQPWTRAEFAAASADRSGDATPSSRPIGSNIALPLPKGSSVIVYDELGAGIGSIIGFTEGAEATMPFTGDAPVDAYCACIVDQVDYQPPAAANPVDRAAL
ncbi:EutN/CcmL family microcompartment protein [Opitutus terrae]|uniref:Ethanolamine utilization protein EutN/carboxysome structural protein CcmL n=1 Tax=Opitutus terrae (strain DSM 11246 / JCM 15787 / PB90-1) TaxID=452637 RepID=B1ZR95_OPITP|nr:EutN/CcmL family microcompartment protein [Opitutus terrae]ACB74582.1 ethanolamine utilization protein EutN/carboxysome structural protein CcmL [Opitutus terrae PB90-1]